MFEEDESGQIILVEGVGHDDLLPICLRNDISLDAFLMWMKKRKIPKTREGLGKVCHLYGDILNNARSGDYVPAKLLTEQELEALGLCKSRRIRVVTAFADEKYEFPEGERDRIEYVNDGYAYYSNASAININTLYREDKEAFKDLIQRKCVEQEAFYTTLIDTLTDKDEFGVLMRLYYKKLLNIIKDVKKRYLPQTVVFAVPEQTKAKKLFSL